MFKLINRLLAVLGLGKKPLKPIEIEKKTSFENSIPQANKVSSNNIPVSYTLNTLSKTETNPTIDTVFFDKYINTWNSIDSKIDFTIIDVRENQVFKILPNIQGDAELESADKRVNYITYVVCPGCKIGGYMGCPDCLGAGGWYETVFGIPTKNTITQKTEIEKVIDRLNLAKNLKFWEPKLEDYFENALKSLGNMIYSIEVEELIAKIQRIRSQKNESRIKDKLYTNYSNNPNQSFFTKSGVIYSIRGELVKRKGNLFIVRTPFSYASYEFQYTQFRNLLSELVESSSAIKINNEYKLIQKNIEIDYNDMKMKHFFLISFKINSQDIYFYILKSRYDEIVTQAAFKLQLKNLRPD